MCYLQLWGGCRSSSETNSVLLEQEPEQPELAAGHAAGHGAPSPLRVMAFRSQQPPLLIGEERGGLLRSLWAQHILGQAQKGPGQTRAWQRQGNLAGHAPVSRFVPQPWGAIPTPPLAPGKAGSLGHRWVCTRGLSLSSQAAQAGNSRGLRATLGSQGRSWSRTLVPAHTSTKAEPPTKALPCCGSQVPAG